MKILHTARDLNPGDRKVCAAIGFFDGVHLGHQQIIRQTVADARQQEALAVVVTFDCHPKTVVDPERVPPLIYSMPQKLRAVAALGVDATLLIHFDAAFSRQTGAQFIQGLARDFGHIHSICVGSNFTFGHRRSGNVALLRRLGQELRFTVHGLAAVSLDRQIVSSTRIRDAIQGGRLDTTSQMLGRSYALAGPVVRGDQLGRRLGFPTANLEVAGRVLPPNGVYAVHVELPGRSHRALLNLGYRPTLGHAAAPLRAEVHLLDFSGELYGRELEATFVEKLRDEQKFASLDALQAQIARDIMAAGQRFGRSPPESGRGLVRPPLEGPNPFWYRLNDTSVAT